MVFLEGKLLIAQAKLIGSTELKLSKEAIYFLIVILLAIRMARQYREMLLPISTNYHHYSNMKRIVETRPELKKH
ncbi:hypothetical protein D3C72_1384600 [compost metagenome]